MLPRHQLRQQGPAEVFAFACGVEWRLPFSGAVLPLHLLQPFDGVKLGQLFRARPFNPRVMDLSGFVWFVSARSVLPIRHGDGHRGLYVKDIVALARAASLASQVEDPDFIAHPAHVFAHAHEGLAVQVAGGADEADYAAVVWGVVFKHFPQGPAPEIDIEVVEVFGVETAPSLPQRVEKIREKGFFAIAVVAPAHPGAGAGFISGSGGLVAVVGGGA